MMVLLLAFFYIQNSSYFDEVKDKFYVKFYIVLLYNQLTHYFYCCIGCRCATVRLDHLEYVDIGIYHMFIVIELINHWRFCLPYYYKLHPNDKNMELFCCRSLSPIQNKMKLLLARSDKTYLFLPLQCQVC